MGKQFEISRINIYPLDVPLLASFNTATSELPEINNLAVAIQLFNGVTGWGEIPILPPVTRENVPIARKLLEQESQILPGKNAGNWRRIAAELQERLPEFGAIRCGLEMALLDALTNSLRIPLFQFFGGSSNFVITDITIPICPVEEAGRLAAIYKSRGFMTLKVKVGQDVEVDIERILAIKDNYKGCRLIVDANTGYTVEQALYLIKTLKKKGIIPDLLEQPVPREDWEGMYQLSQQAGIPVAADESCQNTEDAVRIIRDKIAQVINIKLAKSGVVQALEIYTIARANDIGMMIGGMVETRIAMGFSAHFAAGLGGIDWIDLDTPLLLSQDPVMGGYQVNGASYSLDPDQDGHGGRLMIRASGSNQ